MVNEPNDDAVRREALVERLVRAASMAGLVILYQVAAGAVLPEWQAAVSQAFEFASAELGPAAVPLDGLVYWFVLDRRHPGVHAHWTGKALPLPPDFAGEAMHGYCSPGGDIWLRLDVPVKEAGESAAHEAMHRYQLVGLDRSLDHEDNEREAANFGIRYGRTRTDEGPRGAGPDGLAS